jgi:hypothetical protein
MKKGRFLKRLGLVLVLGLALTVAAVNSWLPRRNSKLTNFEKIKPGMTKAEVESIMGETELYFASGVAGPFALGWTIDASWFSDEYCLIAKFDSLNSKGKVIETRCHPVERSHFHGVLEKLGLVK